MKKNKKSAPNLRQRAEALIKGKSVKLEDLSTQDIQHLLHELQVHQTELNLQNKELQEAQKQLEAARDRYTDLFDFAPNGYIILNTHGLIQEANLTGCRMLGVERGRLIGQPFSKFIAKESQDTYYLERQQAQTSTTSHVYELLLLRADKTTFAAQLESWAFSDSSSNSTQSCTSVTDISERKQAQAVLESEQRLRQLVAAAAEGILLVDEAGNIRMCNASAEQLFGYEEDQLLGQPVERLVPRSQEASHAQQRREFIDQAGTHSVRPGMDLEGVKKDGQRFPAEISLSAFRVGTQRFVTVFVNDISERKQAEAALRKEKETAQLYLDLANSMFVVINRDGSLELINRKGQEILGYSEAQIKGKNWLNNFVPPEHRAGVRAVIAKLMRGEELEAKFFENDILTRNHQRRTIEWHNSVLKNEQGEAMATISSGVDITERKKAQAALFNAIYEGQEQERKRMSRELHDGLSQQLAAAKMLLDSFEPEVVQLEKESQEFYQQAIELLAEAAHETRAISHDLAPRLLEEQGLVPAIRKLAVELSKKDGFSCTVRSLNMQARLTESMEISLYRIVQELITNIIKHAQATQVTIQLKRLKTKVRLVVVDDGVGLQATWEELQHNGIGLRNISSRVKGLQGTFKMDSPPAEGSGEGSDSGSGKGLQVTVEVPVPQVDQ